MEADGISVIIPAYNEEESLGPLVAQALDFSDEVVVVDDGSTDQTAEVAQMAGARVLRQPHSGYISAIKEGFRQSTGSILVTMDADGEQLPFEIPHLVRPIVSGAADLVLGRRQSIARSSERLISRLCRLRVPVYDSGTGFRAFRRSIALKMTFPGVCICGTSVLEAYALGARIVEVPVTLGKTKKPRRIAWKHVLQLFYIGRMLLHP